MTKAGRLTLVRSVLLSIPTYHITIFPLSNWAVKKIDRIQHNFLWKRPEEAKGGHFLVNWCRVCRPTRLGGFGILKLRAFSRALRLCWQWFNWTDPNKPWSGMTLPCSAMEQHLFQWSQSKLLEGPMAGWLGTTRYRPPLLQAIMEKQPISGHDTTLNEVDVRPEEHDQVDVRHSVDSS